MFIEKVLPLVSFVFFLYGSACGMPWDWDMGKQQSHQANEINRSPVKGTVPLKHMPFTMTVDEADQNLKNPQPADEDSIARGRRLWNAQCLTCHGEKGEGNVPVGKHLGVPSLLEGIYLLRTDGRIFGVIHNGQNRMPPYGYKFDEKEKWDLVNYLRSLQMRKDSRLSQ